MRDLRAGDLGTRARRSRHRLRLRSRQFHPRDRCRARHRRRVAHRAGQQVAEDIAERKGPFADPDYMAAACIAIAREVGDKMLERRPVDTQAATAFAVTMILSGLKGLPKAPLPADGA